MLCSIERLAPGIFAEEKGSSKPVCANVDLFSGLIYNMLGISEDLYTPLFAIDQAGAVTHLLAQDAAQILAHLVVILRVLNVLEDILQLAVDHQVRAAVLGTLQGTDGRRDSRVGVRAGG